MKLCRYNDGAPGLIDGKQIYPIGDALAATGAVRSGASMTEIIDALANNPAAAAGLSAARAGTPVALAAATLQAPTLNPPAIWAAARSNSSTSRTASCAKASPCRSAPCV